MLDTNAGDRMSAAFSENDGLENYWGLAMHMDDSWTNGLTRVMGAFVSKAGEVALMIKDDDCVIFKKATEDT